MTHHGRDLQRRRDLSRVVVMESGLADLVRAPE
jgi:hypothetical protein